MHGGTDRGPRRWTCKGELTEDLVDGGHARGNDDASDEELLSQHVATGKFEFDALTKADWERMN